MKNHKSESITIIKGGSAREAVMGRQSGPQPMPTEPTEGQGALFGPRSPGGGSPIRVLTVDLVSPDVEAGAGVFPAGLRDFDSLALIGTPGVLQVGVNELGWVVYDWIPGP